MKIRAVDLVGLHVGDAMRGHDPQDVRMDGVLNMARLIVDTDTPYPDVAGAFARAVEAECCARAVEAEVYRLNLEMGVTLTLTNVTLDDGELRGMAHIVGEMPVIQFERGPHETTLRAELSAWAMDWLRRNPADDTEAVLRLMIATLTDPIGPYDASYLKFGVDDGFGARVTIDAGKLASYFSLVYDRTIISEQIDEVGYMNIVHTELAGFVSTLLEYQTWLSEYVIESPVLRFVGRKVHASPSPVWSLSSSAFDVSDAPERAELAYMMRCALSMTHAASSGIEVGDSLSALLFGPDHTASIRFIDGQTVVAVGPRGALERLAVRIPRGMASVEMLGETEADLIDQTQGDRNV